MPGIVVVAVLLTSAGLAGVGISALFLTVYVLRARHGGWDRVKAGRSGDDPDATIVLPGGVIKALDSFGNHKER